MKIKESRRKKRPPRKNFLLKGGVYQKTGWSNFDEIQVTDSTLNEDNNSLIKKGRADGLSCVVAK